MSRVSRLRFGTGSIAQMPLAASLSIVANEVEPDLAQERMKKHCCFLFDIINR
jgi:hypothetical protein